MAAEAAKEAEAVEAAKVEAAKAAPTTGEVLGVAGPTSRRALTTLLHRSVKNITFLASLLTGVKSQQPALGRTSIFQKTNEMLTSLILTKLLTLYTIGFTRKYMPLPF